MHQIEWVKKSIEEQLFDEVAEVKKMANRVRKSQYAQIGELKKTCKELQSELEFLKAKICKENSLF